MAKLIKCPSCGRGIEYSPQNPYRPFCSERCRLVDLGKWADEAYRIPAEPKSDEVHQIPGEDGDPHASANFDDDRVLH